jgi:cytochrome c-type biogenesis protein CcmH
VRAAALPVALALFLLLPVAARASEQHPTQSELEGELMCPVCAGETLDQSQSAIAQRMKQFIAARIVAGDTKSEIKAKLVAQFGEQVLAAPPRKGFNLLAWLLPIVGIVAAAAVLGVLAWRWSRKRREPSGLPGGAGARLDPELERRLDEELARFDA